MSTINANQKTEDSTIDFIHKLQKQCYLKGKLDAMDTIVSLFGQFNDSALDMHGKFQEQYDDISMTLEAEYPQHYKRDVKDD
jgi:hypothetical protein